MSPQVRALVSVDEFWRLAHELRYAELVAGQVVELVPPGFRHGALVSRLARRLGAFVEDGRYGVLLVETGFILSVDPPTVRGPDLSVVVQGRVPSPTPVKFFPGHPDLAVEVLSPDDRPAEMAAKLADYLRAGTHAVWVIDPEHQTLTVHTPAGAVRYAADEVLRGEPPLPEFELRLDDLFR